MRAGAGWGGCTVHLVRAGEEGKLVDALRESYYARRYPHLAPADLEVACFATRAERGACMYQASA
jgi:galactokinase